MKKIRMDNIDLGIICGNTMYVTIDIFRFTKDESLPCVEVEIEKGGEYEFLEELDEENIVATHEELKKVALNWVFKNVEVI